MTQTTYEEATRCPKCDMPGDVRSRTPVSSEAKMPPGTQLHTVYCFNDKCRWYNTCWYVQVNPDGSVPPPQDHSREPKLYQGFDGHDDAAARIVANLERQVDAETKPGGEIRGR